MRFPRYLLLVAVALISAMARGQFNPVSPAEPAATYKLVVVADPADAAEVSGGGRYAVNKSITVKATASSAFWQLVNWTNSAGEEVSTKASFTYKTTNKNDTLTAHFTPVPTSRLTTQSNPEGKFATNTTTYQVGQTVNLSCNTYSYFTFENWTNSKGEVLSQSRSFTYTVTEEDETLTANYRFTPSNPSEPSQTKPKHKVYFTSTPCSASFNQSNGFQVTEGNSFSLYVWEPSGYAFDGWYVADTLIGSNLSLTTTMGEEDMRLEARFHFQPYSPSEPTTGSKARYSLYGLTSEMYMGETTYVPIYLENTSYLQSLNFTIELPFGITLGDAPVLTTSRTAGYTPEVTASEGHTVTISLSDGTQIGDTNGPILMLPVTTTQMAIDSTYTYTFANISGTLTNASEPTITSRKGALNVSILEEGDLQAQFSVDRYMNRAQFTNLSNGEARSYVWDFGDGTTSTEKNPMHIYAEPGTYTVRLTAKAIIKTDVAEQNIIVNPASTWTASGDYTLDRNATGVRNFTSLREMYELLGQCTPDGTIKVTVATDAPYDMDATQAEGLNLISQLTDKLGKAKQQMTFVAADAELGNIGNQGNIDYDKEGNPILLPTNPISTTGVLSISANAESSELQAITAWAKLIELNNVELRINNHAINLAALHLPISQTVCAETATEEVSFSAISLGDQSVSASWYASVSAGSTLSDYDEIGQGNLLPMSIANSGARTDSVSYHVNYLLDGVPMYAYIYKVYVRPLISKQTIALTSPTQDALLNPGSTTLRWTNLNSIATGGYTVYVSYIDEAKQEKADTIHVSTNSYQLSLRPGCTYQWHVKAHGTCDELDSEPASFSVKDQSDLVVTSVEAPADAKGGTTVTVTATIQNIGRGTTISTSWYDAIYWSTKPNDFAAATLITTKSHSGALAPEGSYQVSFSVTTPESSNGQVYYYVRTDYNNHEGESREDNNFAQSDILELINTYVNEDDYAALKVLYYATNGEVWNTPWKINSNAITSAAWKGVTFNEEGRVTAISLSGNNLVGTVPAEGFTLPYLTSLNLSSNSLSGNIAEFVDELPAITSLNLSDNLFTELTDVLPASITSLDLSYQLKNRALANFEAQHWLLGADMQNIDLTSIMAYDHKAQDFTAHPRLRVVSGSTVVAYLNWNGASYTATTNGNYTIPNDADLLVQPTEGPAAYCKLRAIVGWLLGDANVDGTVDVLDAQHELNEIMGRRYGNWNQLAANVFTDETINVQDIVATINLFLDEEEDEEEDGIIAPIRLRRAAAMSDAEGDVSLLSTPGKLMLQAAMPVAALDVELEGVKSSQVSLNLNRSRFQMIARDTKAGVRVVIISPMGDEIPAGEQAILRLSAPATVVSATAADVEAQRMSVKRISEATGLSSASSEEEEGYMFDLSGRRIEKANAQGIYIMNGKKVLK